MSLAVRAVHSNSTSTCLHGATAHQTIAKPDLIQNTQICTNAMSHLILLRAMPHHV